MACESRTKCTKNRIGKRITRYADEELRREMMEKMRENEGYEIYKQRAKTIEPIFGNIKQNIGFRAFSMRRIIKTRGEFFLVAAVHNLIKIKSQLDKVKRLLIAEMILVYS